MKVLAIDIGAGTSDILLYDDSKRSIENCIKMVLPSPCLIYAEKVATATQKRVDLFLRGDTIGGGPLSHTLKRHIETGHKVYATETAAYTLRNSLEQVKTMGIRIVDESGPEDFKGETLILEEVNINQLRPLLSFFGEPLTDVDYVAVAVQDHGVFPEGTSNRQSRINKMKGLLEKNPKPEAFAFMEDEVPSFYPRMRSAVAASKRQLPSAKVLVMDTAPDAIFGCLLDPAVEGADPILAVNVGNGHTMAAIISGGEVIALLEHHTCLLREPGRMGRLLRDFADGRLSGEQVFEEEGHGMFYLKEPPGFLALEKVVVTGPNRNILSEADFAVHFATPAGDVMMTGPVGLVEAVKRKIV